jgi:hypothetical protein
MTRARSIPCNANRTQMVCSRDPARTDGVYNLACDTPMTLTHDVIDEGHAHPFTTGSASNVPAHRYLRFIERIDNSA